jgi:DNA-binding LacI/PurR family transcriptional regulator
LGYQGRSRRGTGKTPRLRTIRVLFAGNSLTDIQTGAITMAYLQGMTSETEAARVSLNVQTAPVDGPPDRGGRKTPNVMNHREGDAVIIVGPHDRAAVANLARNLPVVSVVRAYEGVRHDCVSTDDLSGISQLVRRLADFGHRTMAWVSVEDHSSYSHARRAGFLEGCLSSGLDLSRQDLIHGVFEGGTLIRPERILQAVRNGVTAFVAASDHAAYEVSEILSKESIAIPGGISLTGFDAIGEPGRRSLDFTTYNPNFVEIGRAAVRLALWRLENLSAASMQLTIGGCLVEGRTTGPVAGSHRTAPGARQPKSAKTKPVRTQTKGR